MARYIKTEDAIPYLTRYIPSVEAVERSKIDTAIEQTYKVREEVLHSNTTYEPNDVLEIIDEITDYFEEI